MSETPKQTIHNTEQIKYEEEMAYSESESSEIDTCPHGVLCDTILATILPSNKQFRDIMDNLTLQVVESKKSEAEYDKMKAERDAYKKKYEEYKKKYEELEREVVGEELLIMVKGSACEDKCEDCGKMKITYWEGNTCQCGEEEEEGEEEVAIKWDKYNTNCQQSYRRIFNHCPGQSCKELSPLEYQEEKIRRNEDVPT